MKLFFPIFIFLSFYSCDNCNSSLFKYEEIEISELKDYGDNDLFKTIMDIHLLQENSIIDKKIDFRFSIQNNSIVDFLVKSNDSFYKVYNSSGYELSDKRFITHTKLSDAIDGKISNVGYQFCEYQDNNRNNFCITKINETYKYQEYLYGVPNGKYIEINEGTETIGEYKFNLSSKNQFTIDTFIEFDATYNEEYIKVRKRPGKAFKHGHWIVKNGTQVEEKYYNMGKLINE